MLNNLKYVDYKECIWIRIISLFILLNVCASISMFAYNKRRKKETEEKEKKGRKEMESGERQRERMKPLRRKLLNLDRYVLKLQWYKIPIFIFWLAEERWA